MPARFDLVIFDCDGVLVDTEPLGDEIVSQALAEAGLVVAPRDVNRLTRGISDADAWSVLEGEVGAAIPSTVLDRVRELSAESLFKVLPIPGVIDVLDRLAAAEVAVCVASSGSQRKMAVTFGTTGIELYFDGNIFSATQVSHGKPAPDLFLFAAERMSTLPERCVVIEDSYNGVQAGLAAGMTVLGFVQDKYGDDRIHYLDVQTFSAMSDLPALLGLDAVP